MSNSQSGSREYKRDLRWPAALLCTIIGASVVLLTRVVAGHDWFEFAVNAAYSIGWTLVTFAALYLLSGRFESWKWGREDHDMAKVFDEGLK